MSRDCGGAAGSQGVLLKEPWPLLKDRCTTHHGCARLSVASWPNSLKCSRYPQMFGDGLVVVYMKLSSSNFASVGSSTHVVLNVQKQMYQSHQAPNPQIASSFGSLLGEVTPLLPF
jgi:hypothetical protein